MPDPDTTHEQRMAELGHDWEPDGYYQHCRRCETVASRGAPLGICPHKDRLALAYLSELHARAEKAERQVEAERERCARVCDDEAEALRVSHEPGAAMCLEDAARRIREPPQAEEPTP